MRVLCLLALTVLLSLAPKMVLAQSCSATSTGIYFGNVVTPVPQTDATGTISVSCTGGSSNGVANVCIGIDPAGSLLNRVMMRDGDQFLGTLIDYEIYSKVNRTTIWNTTNRVLVSVPLGGSGSGTANVTMYGRMDAGGNPAAGVFRSGLSDDSIQGVVQRGASCNSQTTGSFTGGTFDVNTFILGTCTISADALLDFGTVAGNMPAARNSTSALHVNCTNQLPYTLALDAGTVSGSTIAVRLLANSSGSTVRFQLYRDSARTSIWGDGINGTVQPGTGNGANQDILIHGQVPQQTNLSSGTYRTDVRATVTY